MSSQSTKPPPFSSVLLEGSEQALNVIQQQEPQNPLRRSANHRLSIMARKATISSFFSFPKGPSKVRPDPAGSTNLICTCPLNLPQPFLAVERRLLDSQIFDHFGHSVSVPFSPFVSVDSKRLRCFSQGNKSRTHGAAISQTFESFRSPTLSVESGPSCS